MAVATEAQTAVAESALPVSLSAEQRLRDLFLQAQGLPTQVPPAEVLGDIPSPYPPLRLNDALAIAAGNSNEYQNLKDGVFTQALDVDLARDEYRKTWAGVTSATLDSSDGSWGGASGLSTTLSRLTRNGARVSTGLALDLAHLVTSGGHSSFGILADTSINVPLLSGAGEAVVGESLTQAERSLRYALFRLERFRQSLALRTASEFLDVLQLRDRVQNAERNHLSLVTAAKRADALAEAGRVPAIAVDEARQDELRARDRLVVARQSFASRLDRFKTTLGLPPDAKISLDHDELKNLLRPIREALLVAEGMKPQSEAEMIEVGLRKRLDLRTSQLRVEDEERQEKIAADRTRASLALVASGSTGGRRSSSGAGTLANAGLDPATGSYSMGLDGDFPWEKTAAAHAYRRATVSLEQARRSHEDLEDQIKLGVRNSLRQLQQARESARIQAEAVRLAQRRIDNTTLQLEAGRAQVRDILFAQEAFLSTQNELTSALRNFWVARLQLQFDTGMLRVSADGLLPAPDASSP